MRQTKNKNLLSKQWSIIWYKWSFTKFNLKTFGRWYVQNCKNRGDTRDSAPLTSPWTHYHISSIVYASMPLLADFFPLIHWPRHSSIRFQSYNKVRRCHVIRPENIHKNYRSLTSQIVTNILSWLFLNNSTTIECFATFLESFHKLFIVWNLNIPHHHSVRKNKQGQNVVPATSVLCDKWYSVNIESF